jgi:hypothetical protein
MVYLIRAPLRPAHRPNSLCLTCHNSQLPRSRRFPPIRPRRRHGAALLREFPGSPVRVLPTPALCALPPAQCFFPQSQRCRWCRCWRLPLLLLYLLCSCLRPPQPHHLHLPGPQRLRTCRDRGALGGRPPLPQTTTGFHTLGAQPLALRSADAGLRADGGEGHLAAGADVDE